MCRGWVIFLFVLATATSVTGVIAQSPHRLDTEASLFFAPDELVVVHVIVTDRRGAYVTGLSRDAFGIVEDVTPQRVDVLSGEDSPLTVGLFVDSSGSMRGGRARVAATPLAPFHPTRYAMAKFRGLRVLVADPGRRRLVRACNGYRASEPLQVK